MSLEAAALLAGASAQDGMFGVTKGIYESLKAKNLSEYKFFLIKNGTNPERYHYILNQHLEERLGWKARFVVLYAGVHGVAQGLEIVLESASLLKHMNSIHLAFVGEGPVKDWLIIVAKKRELYNVEFLSEVPTDEIAKYISLASLSLVPLKKK